MNTMRYKAMHNVSSVSNNHLSQTDLLPVSYKLYQQTCHRSRSIQLLRLRRHTSWTASCFSARSCVTSRPPLPTYVSIRSVNSIVEEGVGTHKPTSLQKKMLVYAKMYPSVQTVPERVTRQQMKKAMDKFRIRVSLIMCAMTVVGAAIMAMIGRKERSRGISVTSRAHEERRSGHK